MLCVFLRNMQIKVRRKAWQGERSAYLQEQISQRNLSWHTENCAWMSVSDMMSTLSLHLGQLRHGGVFSRHWHLRRCSLQGRCTGGLVIWLCLSLYRSRRPLESMLSYDTRVAFRATVQR